MRPGLISSCLLIRGLEPSKVTNLHPPLFHRLGLIYMGSILGGLSWTFSAVERALSCVVGIGWECRKRPVPGPEAWRSSHRHLPLVVGIHFERKPSRLEVTEIWTQHHRSMLHHTNFVLGWTQPCESPVPFGANSSGAKQLWAAATRLAA